MRFLSRLCATMAVLSTIAAAQGGFTVGVAQASSLVNGTSVLVPLPGATVLVCTAAASGTPCTPTATLYTNATLAVSTGSSTVTADSSGNYQFFTKPGFYQVQISYPGIATFTQPVLVAPDAANFTSTFQGAQNFEGVRWADQFPSIAAAVTAAGATGAVAIPPNYAPLDKILSNPNNIPIIDYRGEHSYRSNYNIRDYGAQGDMVILGNEFTGVGTCSTTIGSFTVNCPSGNFSAVTDPNKLVEIYCAGGTATAPSTSCVPLVSHIQTVVSGTQFTTNNAAASSQTNIAVRYYTDDAPALRAAAAAAGASGGAVFIPCPQAGKYYGLGSALVQNGIRYYIVDYLSNVDFVGESMNCNGLVVGASMPDQARVLSSHSTDFVTTNLNNHFYNFALDGSAIWQPNAGVPSTTAAASMSLVQCVNCVNVHWDNLRVYDAKASSNSVVSTAARTGGNLETIVTTAPHFYGNGEVIATTGLTGDTTQNCPPPGCVITVVNPTTYTYASTGSNVSATTTGALAIPENGSIGTAEGTAIDCYQSLWCFMNNNVVANNTVQSGGGYSSTNSSQSYWTGNVSDSSSFWQCYATHGDRGLFFAQNSASRCYQRGYSLETDTDVTFALGSGGDLTSGSPIGPFTANFNLSNASGQGVFCNNSNNIKVLGMVSNNNGLNGYSFQSCNKVVMDGVDGNNNTGYGISLSGTTQNVTINQANLQSNSLGRIQNTTGIAYSETNGLPVGSDQWAGRQTALAGLEFDTTPATFGTWLDLKDVTDGVHEYWRVCGVSCGTAGAVADLLANDHATLLARFDGGTLLLGINGAGMKIGATVTQYTAAGTATAGLGVAPIWYNTASASVNANIAATTMVTAPATNGFCPAGMPANCSVYEVSWYIDVSAVGTSCTGTTTAVFNLLWTDPSGAGQQTLATSALNLAVNSNGTLGSLVGQGVNVIVAKTATTVQYSTSGFTAGTGCSPAPKYQVVAVLKQLS